MTKKAFPRDNEVLKTTKSNHRLTAWRFFLHQNKYQFNKKNAQTAETNYKLFDFTCHQQRFLDCDNSLAWIQGGSMNTHSTWLKKVRNFRCDWWLISVRQQLKFLVRRTKAFRC
jgi:hypothetical protein